MSWRLHATLTIVCGTCPVAMWCRSSKAVVAAHGQCVRSVSYNPNKPRYGGNAFFVARVCILGPFGAARLAHKSPQVAVTVGATARCVKQREGCHPEQSGCCRGRSPANVAVFVRVAQVYCERWRRWHGEVLGPAQAGCAGAVVQGALALVMASHVKSCWCTGCLNPSTSALRATRAVAVRWSGFGVSRTTRFMTSYCLAPAPMATRCYGECQAFRRRRCWSWTRRTAAQGASMLCVEGGLPDSPSIQLCARRCACSRK